MIPPDESPSELLDRLRAEQPGWQIHAHPLGLGLWTAERRSDDGRSLHHPVRHTGAELAERLAQVGATWPPSRVTQPGALRVGQSAQQPGEEGSC